MTSNFSHPFAARPFRVITCGELCDSGEGVRFFNLNTKVRHIDLFSGIGGFSLAARWMGWETIGHSEVDEYACKVYHKHFPNSEHLGDITKIKWHEGQADIITGGFPCQPHSVAGKRKASADERDLWGECVRALRGVRPRYALFENVPGLITSERGGFFNRVLTDIHESGYNAEWQIISAADVGAPHLRERVWIVAYSCKESESSEINEWKESLKKRGAFWNNIRTKNQSESEIPYPEKVDDECNDSQRRTSFKFGNSNRGNRTNQWATEPDVGRVVNGLPFTVDRLAGLGNAIVPQVAFLIFQMIEQQ